jgi:16S rRNA (uracil1498-N3)-methyltransferase
MAHVPRIHVYERLAPGPIALDPEASRRLGSVMRLRVGDEFRLFGLDAREWSATVTAVGRGSIQATVGELVRQEAPPALSIEVWCGLIRPARFDWMVEKCTEAGADVIRPLATEHAGRGEDGSEGRHARWQRIAVEASEQCGRLTVPLVQRTALFSALTAGRRGPALLCSRDGKRWPDVLARLPEHGTIVVAVGPEGGFSPPEHAAATAAGAIPVRLGPNVLRTETAAVAVVTLLRSLAPGE